MNLLQPILCFTLLLFFGCSSVEENEPIIEIDPELELPSDFCLRSETPLNLVKLGSVLKASLFDEPRNGTYSLYDDEASIMSREEVESIFKPYQNYFFYADEDCHFMSFEDSLERFMSFTAICYSKFDTYETFLITCDYEGNVIDHSQLGGYSHGSNSYGTGEIWEWKIEVVKEDAFQYQLNCAEIVPFDAEEERETEYRESVYQLSIDSLGVIDNIEISDWKTVAN